MSTRKTISRIILAASIFAAGLAPASANAAVTTTGTTTMTVTMPEYIVLRYYKNINLNFTASSSATGIDEAKTFDAKLGPDGAVSYDAEIAGATALGSAKKTVTLNNVWSIAGLSPSGTAKVAIEGTDMTNADNKSTIGASNWKVSSSGVSADKVITTALRGAGGAATSGNVIMDLDFGSTTKSGAHTGTFTLSVETI
ncbi:MAG: hypothetical protein A3K90_05240 [Pelodictyon luteolum]|uniref:DUF4402 domain-containing protein n=1 Tax=Pelodictyon luteolum TaxID=1100 RepID=A0A165LWT2_PELLU|nr:hypothetical protein [Pelodictyon luteolum]KZK74528.1 MAG: hypothetical protein A3K90_05240 [Pelodictyon luteolum]